MSETTTPQPASEPQPNAPSVDPAAQPQPAAAPAPEALPPEPAEQTEEQQAADAKAREDRRIAQLTAKLAAASRERDRQAAELEFWRQQAAKVPAQEETPEQAAMRQRAEIRAEVEADLTARRFHEDGQAQYPDWQQRCQDLMSLGADPGFAKLLVETPGGVRIAAALAEDAEAVQRIAGLRTASARAVALGKYAATLEANGHDAVAQVPRVVPAAAAAQVTRAPAPIRPVTGRASPVFNEYTATPEQLIEHYMRQNIERQQRR